MEDRKERRMPQLVSQVLALIFHPVFLPVYGLLLIFYAPTFMFYLPLSMKRVIFMLAVVNMSVVPLALMPLLRYRNIISSYNMETTRERIIPLTLGVVMYLVTTIILFTYQIPMLIKTFMLSATISSVILLLVTFRWKISIHSAGFGAMVGLIISLSVRMETGLTGLLLLLILLSGIVMMSRLFLRVHTPQQVYFGFLAGFIPFIGVMVYFG